MKKLSILIGVLIICSSIVFAADDNIQDDQICSSNEQRSILSGSVDASSVIRQTQSNGGTGKIKQIIYYSNTGYNLDIYVGDNPTCPQGPIILDINTGDLSKVKIKSARLVLRMWDVDQFCYSYMGFEGMESCDWACERDAVYFNGYGIGYLSGVNNQWTTVSFNIPVQYIKATNQVYIDISIFTNRCWCTTCDFGALVLRVEEEPLELKVSGGPPKTVDPYANYYNPARVTAEGYIHGTWAGGLYENGKKVPTFPITITANKDSSVFVQLWKNGFWLDDVLDTQRLDVDAGEPSTYNLDIRNLDPGTYHVEIDAYGGDEEKRVNMPSFNIVRRHIFFPGDYAGGASGVFRADANFHGPDWNDLFTTLIKPVGALFGPIGGAFWTLTGYMSTASMRNMYVDIEWKYTPFEWDSNRHNYVQRSRRYNVGEGQYLIYRRRLVYEGKRFTVLAQKEFMEGAKWVLTAKKFLVEYGGYIDPSWGKIVGYFVQAVDTADKCNDLLQTITKYEFKNIEFWGVGGKYIGYDVFGPRPQLVDLSMLTPGLKEEGTYSYYSLYSMGVSSDVRLLQQDSVKEYKLPIDSSVQSVVFGLKWQGNYTLSLELKTPNKEIINDSKENVTHSRFITDSLYDIYYINHPQVGEWNIKVISDNKSIANPEYYLKTVFESSFQPTLFFNKEVYSVNEPIGISVYLFDNEKPITNAYVELKVFKPGDDKGETLVLYDDGLHNDRNADDGVYSNIFENASIEGHYFVNGRVNGTKLNSESFLRYSYNDIYVQNGPLVSIDSLYNGTTVNEIVNIAVSAIDDKDIFLNYTIAIHNVNVSYNNFYVWNTSIVENGNYTVTAYAIDSEGNRGMASVTIGVFNPVDSTVPAIPSGLNLQVLEVGNLIALDWQDNPENNVLGYNVYRSFGENGSYVRLNSEPDNVSYFEDSELAGAYLYYYKVTAVSKDFLESNYSVVVSGIPLETWNDFYDDFSKINSGGSNNIRIEDGVAYLINSNECGNILSKKVPSENVQQWRHLYWVNNSNSSITMRISQDGINWVVIGNHANISNLNPNLGIYYNMTICSKNNGEPNIYVTRISFAPDSNPLGIISLGPDYGVDDNNNSLYDRLVVEALVNIPSEGVYYMSGDLIDTNGKVVYPSIGDYELEPGKQNLILEFDGGSIQRNKVDGPYNIINIKLLDSYNNLIDIKGNYTTLSYHRSDFEKTYAKLTGNYFEYVKDNNNNLLYDYLGISAELEVYEKGNYQVIASLVANPTIAYAANLSNLSVGKHNISLNFNGVSIRASKLNGPYNLSNVTLFYEDSSLNLDAEQDAYVTSPYNYADFETQPIGFVSFSDNGSDTDNDGLFNYLVVEMDLNTSLLGNYTLRCALIGNNSIKVDNSESVHFNESRKRVSLRFDGMDIYNKQVGGSFNLSCDISDSYGFYLGSQINMYSTAQYSYTEFQRPMIVMLGNYSDQGIDLNNNSLYDSLRTRFLIRVEKAGNYSVNARLVDRYEKEITWAQNSLILESNKEENITLDFDGHYIYGNRKDGPYFVRDLHIYYNNITSNGLYIDNFSVTSNYSFLDFEAVATIEGYVFDEHHDRIKDIYVYIYDVDGGIDTTNEEGFYRVLLRDSGVYKLETRAPLTENYKDTSTLINIALGQIVNRNITLYMGGIMKGKVFDNNGEPVKEASIKVIGPVNRTERSDINGSYYIAQLRNGSYNAIISPPYLSNLLETSFYISIVEGKVTEKNVSLEVYGVLKGVVTDSKGVPIKDVYVQACVGLTTGGLICSGGSSDANGTYKIIRLSNNSYEVKASSPASSNFMDYNTTVSITLGKISYLNISLEEGGMLNGVIVDKDKMPIEKAIVFVQGPVDEWDIYKSIYSDKNGKYNATKLKNGNYSVQVIAPTHMNILPVSFIVTIIQGKVVEKNITLSEEGGILTGAITDGSGDPIEDAYIYIYNMGGSSTDENGIYNITKLKNGTYSGYVVAPQNINLVRVDFNVTIIQGEVVEKNITLSEKGGILTGVITDINGKPIEGAQIRVCDSSQCRYDDSDQNGIYNITGLKSGAYDLYAYPPYESGFMDYQTEVNITTGTTTYLNVSLERGATLTGLITDVDGNPVVNAYVHIEGPFYSGDYSDENGRYSITGLVGGYYGGYVEPSNGGFTRLKFEVDVPSGQTVEKDIILIGEYGLIGRVTDDKRVPVENAYIQLCLWEAGGCNETYSDENGIYMFLGLLEESYLGWADPPYDKNLIGWGSFDFSMPSDSSIEKNIVFYEGGILTGIIRNSQGQHIVDAYINVGGQYVTDYSDTNGEYNITRLWSGTNEVYVYAPSSSNYSNYYSEINITQGQTTYLNITLFESLTVVGIIGDSNGTPVYNAYIILKGPSFEWDYSDMNGFYNLTKLTNGSYNIYVNPSWGVNLLEYSGIANLPNIKTNYLNFTLQIGGMLTGHVLHINGTPIENAYLTLFKVNESSGKFDYSDENGTYEFIRLKNGTYTLSYNPPDGTQLQSYEKIINIIEGEVSYLDIFVKKVLRFMNISLNQGWNLISIPLDQINNTVAGVFQSVDGDYSKIFSYNEKWFELQNDDKIDETLGFWIKMLRDDTLVINGTAPNNVLLNLNKGWNLVGYPSLDEKEISAVFNNVSMVYSYDGSWSSYIPNRTSNSLQIMKPGYGYWVKVE